MSLHVITVHYKCACMQDEGSMTMRPRGDGEAIEDFMDRMGMNLAIDHRARNPICRSQVMEYVKLPVGEHGAGGAT